ncbi:hypothetical protein STANM309S_01871 [Streptomyces tanashiensis]
MYATPAAAATARAVTAEISAVRPRRRGAAAGAGEVPAVPAVPVVPVAPVGGGGVSAVRALPSASSSRAACRPSRARTSAGSQGSATGSVSTISVAVGRAAGSLARHARMSPESSGGRSVRSGSSWAMRNMVAWTPLSAVPKGARPVAAYARTDPRQKMSEAGETWSPRTCSGDMKPGEPTTAPVVVRLPPSATLSTARAMPKSMILGPSTVSSTLPGLRSRWTSPAAWMWSRARASPEARARTVAGGSGPNSSPTTVRSEGPATYPMATHGESAVVSEPRTGAVPVPPTRSRAATSRANRRRNSSWAASSACTTLTATVRPPAERARNTRPIPPTPRRPIRRNGPTLTGSSAFNDSTSPEHARRSGQPSPQTFSPFGVAQGRWPWALMTSWPRPDLR